MYPKQALILLSAQKAAVRRRIQRGRADGMAAAAQALRPLEWLDRMLAWWKRLSPFAQLAAVPLGLLIQRRGHPRLKTLGCLLRWGSPVLHVLRGFASTRHAQSSVTKVKTRSAVSGCLGRR